MARRGPESVIVNRIKVAIIHRWPTAVVIKIHGGAYQQAGLPDLICCIEGKFVAIEVKTLAAYRRDDHSMTPLQKRTLGLVERAGGVAMCAYDEHMVMANLDETGLF
jgi:hypothetical protein